MNRSDEDDLFVYVTGGESVDHKAIEKKCNKLDRVFLRFIDHDYSGSGKVGSLYNAYNQLMGECKTSGYKYLNLMQSDFQLLWWDGEIVNHYLEIFQEFPNALQINTGFVRQGSQPDVFRNRFHLRELPSGGRIPFVSAYGICDWGFLHLERIFRCGLTWSGNESMMAYSLSQKGFVLPLSRIPCVAPIPWPAVIRNGKQRGKMIKRSEELLLRPKQNNALSSLKKLKNEPLWQEEWITSWGWWSMQPTWATEFTPEYFVIRQNNTNNRELQSISWSKYGKADSLLPPLLAQRRPTYTDICKVYLRFVYCGLKNVVRRWVSKGDIFRKIKSIYPWK